MAKRFYKYFPWLFVLGEISILYFMIWVFLLVFSNYPTPFFTDLFDFHSFAVIWAAVVLVKKDYKLGRTSSYEDTLKQLFGSFFWGMLIFFLFRNYGSPYADEQVPVPYYIGLLFVLAFYRVAVHKSLRRYRISGRNYRRAVIFGRNPWSEKLAQTFEKQKEFGIQFLGFYDDENREQKTMGNSASFFKKAELLGLDLIYLSQRLDPVLVKKIIEFADENYIKVKIIPGPNLQLEKKMTFSKYGDFVVVNLNEIPLDQFFNRFWKRSFDVIFSLFVLVFIMTWLVPIIGVLIKMESKGPVLFVQNRNGANNRIFKCFKFRTMVDNPWADTLQATRNDPRITKIGAFLRKYSLDEMPQFINVLLGDMSVVGPRPHTLPMNKMFKGQLSKYNNRHRIKPGITGLAQVLGYRGEILNTFQIRSRVKLDYFYIENWSFILDMSIIFKTLRELVLQRENVY